MSISAKAVRLDDDSMCVELSDGGTIGVPYAWFPRLGLRGRWDYGITGLRGQLGESLISRGTGCALVVAPAG
jgi:hypothetical protein